MITAPRRRTVEAAATALGAAALVSTAIVASTSATESSTGGSAASLRHVCARATAKDATVVLVHGAFANTASWIGEVRSLTRAGCSVRAISNPLRSLTTDAQTVADFAGSLPGPVVLVGHSYGGSVITNAGAEASNVVGLVYIDAAIPAPGEATTDLTGADSAFVTEPPAEVLSTVPYPDAPDGAMNAYLTREFFTTQFGHDLPRKRAERLWATQNAASTAALGGKSQYAAWRKLPSWSLVSSGDNIITPGAKKVQNARAHARVTYFHGGSHLTLVSHPEAATAVIAKALAGTTGR